jgi:hypothetical protein
MELGGLNAGLVVGRQLSCSLVECLAGGVG